MSFKSAIAQNWEEKNVDLVIKQLKWEEYKRLVLWLVGLIIMGWMVRDEKIG